MSKAVIHGDTVYLAGIVADSPKGKSVAEQTENILSQIDGFLALAGTGKTKLLSANSDDRCPRWHVRLYNSKAPHPKEDKGPARFHDRNGRRLLLPSGYQSPSVPRDFGMTSVETTV